MIQTLVRKKQVMLFVDIHGHSREDNVFIYGVEPAACMGSNGMQGVVVVVMLTAAAAAAAAVGVDVVVLVVAVHCLSHVPMFSLYLSLCTE